MNQEKTFYDNLVECLKHQQKKSSRTVVDSEVLKVFFSTSTKLKNTKAAPHITKATSSPSSTVTEHRITPINPPEFGHKQTPESCPIEELSLDELRIMAVNCRRCGLCDNRNNVVFGEGDPHAKLMFIGEGPGADEDAQGRPFVGAAGQLLTRMISAMQYRREEVYITNIVKCRPPGNRTPVPSEANSCMPYLRRQIELINPKVIVLLGGTPLLHILNLTGITRRRGQWGEYNKIPVMPTFHPSYVLRFQNTVNERNIKSLVWSDLKTVMQFLGKPVA